MRAHRALTVAAAVAGGLVMAFPLLWLLSSALKYPSDVLAYPPEFVPPAIRWQNFPDALRFLGARTFLNSVIFTVGVVVLQLGLTVTAGFGLARLPFHGSRLLLVVFVGTLLVPPQVMLIPSFLVVRDLGLLNTYLGLILPIAAQTGFGTFLFHQFFLKLPHELLEAARVDGAGWLRTFRSIALPLSIPAMSAYCAVTFLTAWNLYAWPLVAATSTDLRVLPLALAQLGATDSYLHINVGLNAVLLSSLPLFVVFAFAQRAFEQGLAGSGMKG